VIRVLLAAWALAAVAVVAGQGLAQSGSSRVLVAAHRGGALLWPENSLLAFRNAAGLDVDYLELDVHLSRDGELVVIHDPTLERTTTGTGAVRDRTLADLRTLRLKDRSGVVTEEPIPTFDEVAALASSAGRRLLLEIKVGPDRARYPEIEEKVLAALERHRLADGAVVMAFEEATWRRIRELKPSIRAGALYSPRMLERSGRSVDAVLDEARQAGVAFVGLHQALADSRAVERAMAAGILLGVWTVNEPVALQRIFDLGAAIVISDRPDLAARLRPR